MPDDDPASAGFLLTCDNAQAAMYIGGDWSTRTLRQPTAIGHASQPAGDGNMGNAFRKAVCISVAATMALAGCGTPKKLDAIPASSTQYAHLDCEQLNAEAQRVLARYVELGGKIDEDFKAEQALEPLLFLSVIIVPLHLLWLPFVPGRIKELEERGQREDEYRRLMGERNAILQAAAEKACPGVAQQPKTGGEPKTTPDATK